MNDNEDEDLTEAQCRLIQVLTNGVWRRLKGHDPEVVANVISAVLAEFLSNWGTQHPPPLRRRIQVEIITSLAQVTFDLLDVRAAKEDRKPKDAKPH